MLRTQPSLSFPSEEESAPPWPSKEGISSLPLTVAGEGEQRCSQCICKGRGFHGVHFFSCVNQPSLELCLWGRLGPQDRPSQWSLNCLAALVYHVFKICSQPGFKKDNASVNFQSSIKSQKWQPFSYVHHFKSLYSWKLASNLWLYNTRGWVRSERLVWKSVCLDFLKIPYY